MTICKFCGKDKKLIKAHLFPKGLRKYLSEDNEYITVRPDDKYRKVTNKIYNLEFDENILCRRCDGDILGPYDGYLINIVGIFLNDPKRKLPHIGNAPVVDIIEIKSDVNKFMLSVLVSLWRHSISKRSTVDLGDKYDYIIKQWIKQGSITNNKFIKIYGVGAKNNTSKFGGPISNIGRIKTNKFFYKFIICDILFIIEIGNATNTALASVPEISTQNKTIQIPLIAKDFCELLSALDKDFFNSVIRAAKE